MPHFRRFPRPNRCRLPRHFTARKALQNDRLDPANPTSFVPSRQARMAHFAVGEDAPEHYAIAPLLVDPVLMLGQPKAASQSSPGRTGTGS